MSGAQSSHLLVAAIDFGTTYSGFAFSFVGQPNKIFMPKAWGGKVAGYKTPTCLCISVKNGKNELKWFGWEAMTEYSNQKCFENDESDEELYLFKNFKMQLYGENRLHKGLKLKSTDGQKELPAHEIFAMALVFMKDKLVDQVNRAREAKVTADDIQWVITVPAIWSDAAKDFMRRAAFEAKLIEALDSPQLKIALEPEAASIYCRSKEVGCVFEGEEDGNMPKGTKYLVIDAGGGTIDIAAHEVTNKGLRELYPPTGGHWGSTQIDRNFENLLIEIFGQDVIDYYKEQYGVNWLNLIESFEQKKREKGERFAIDVNMLDNASKDRGKPGVVEAFKAMRDKGRTNMKFSNGLMQFSKDEVSNLIDPVVKLTVDHVEELLKKRSLKGISYIMLVGGFGECHRLQEMLRERFSHKLKLLIPQETVLAVVQGAVMFGYHPEVIESRVSPLTYGILVYEDFVPGLHDRSRVIYTREGGEMVRDVFSVFIRKNQHISLADKIPPKKFYPSTTSAHEGELKLFAVDREDVKYVDEEGVKEVGCVTLDIPAGTSLDDPINVSLKFGGTEILVEAEDTKQGAVKAHATLTFLPA